MRNFHKDVCGIELKVISDSTIKNKNALYLKNPTVDSIEYYMDLCVDEELTKLYIYGDIPSDVYDTYEEFKDIQLNQHDNLINVDFNNRNPHQLNNILQFDFKKK